MSQEKIYLGSGVEKFNGDLVNISILVNNVGISNIGYVHKILKIECYQKNNKMNF